MFCLSTFEDGVVLIFPKCLVRGPRHALGSVPALFEDVIVLISPKRLVRGPRHALGFV